MLLHEAVHLPSAQRRPGGLEQHATFFPMQFFSNNWIYEGLVRYGAGGAVEPALATEWASTVNSDGSETVRFRMAHRGPDRLAAELPRHCLSLSPSLLVIVCKDN